VSALGAVLALAAQVVTVQADDLPRKPVYVRVGVGVESRLLLPDALVRVTGPRAAGARLGLKLGQARPQTLLIFKPREAGGATFTYVGTRTTMRLAVEASLLGSALDAELRLAEAPPGGPASSQVSGVSSLATAAPATPGPTKNLTPRQALPRAESPRPPDESRVASEPRSQVPESSSVATTPPAVATQTLGIPSLASQAPASAQAPLTHAPSSTAPGLSQEIGSSSLASSASIDASSASNSLTLDTGAAPALDGGGPPPPPRPAVTRRPAWRLGRPGQCTVVIEELHEEPRRRLLAVRIEGAARARAATVELRGVPVPVTTYPDGRDLVLIATLPVESPARPDATLLLHVGRAWTRTPLPLDALDRGRALPGGSS
jgi:hypothetical protein